MSSTGFADAHYSRSEVYLSGQTREPKHLFKVVVEKILARGGQEGPRRLLDVGAACGDFGALLRSSCPNCEVTCLEYDPKLIERGVSLYPDITFIQGDAANMTEVPSEHFDYVSLLGVLSIFDDCRPVLRECIRAAKPGGYIVIMSQFNDWPVDILTRWRYSGDEGPFHLGYNKFAKETVARFLGQEPRVASWTWEDFHLPFDLAPQQDPMRTWTEFDTSGKRILKNGLGVQIQFKFLEITLKA